MRTCLIQVQRDNGKIHEEHLEDVYVLRYCNRVLGILFGSYFGDIFDIVGSTFFEVTDLPVIPPLWFFPVEKPMLMLTFSMGFGIVHLLTGLAMSGYQMEMKKDYKGIIYDVGLWFVLLISGIVLLLSMKMVTDIL